MSWIDWPLRPLLPERSWEFPRHLLAAERAARHGEPVDQEDVDELATTDFADLTRRVEQGQALPADVAGLRDALAGLEGPAVEFKKSWPDQNRDLAREFAALGPVGGTVYLGVDDDGSVAGLSVDTSKELDQFDLRIRGIAEKSVAPPLALTTTWLASRGRVVCAVRMLASGEPIHCVDKVPIIRDGSASRPARPEEVKSLF